VYIIYVPAAGIRSLQFMMSYQQDFNNQS